MDMTKKLLILLLVFCMSFAAGEACTNCQLMEGAPPSVMSEPVMDDLNNVTEVYIYYENYSNTPSRTPIADAVIFVQPKTETRTDLWRIYTDENGRAAFDFSAYKDEYTTFVFFYCPFCCPGEDAACFQECVKYASIETTAASMDEVPLAAGAAEPATVNCGKYLPSLARGQYTPPPEPAAGTPAFCLPLVLIFTLLGGALYYTGRNPFGAFSLGTPKPGKHIRYAPRGRGVSVSGMQIAQSIAQAKSEAKEKKDAKAAAKKTGAAPKATGKQKAKAFGMGLLNLVTGGISGRIAGTKGTMAGAKGVTGGPGLFEKIKAAPAAMKKAKLEGKAAYGRIMKPKEYTGKGGVKEGLKGMGQVYGALLVKVAGGLLKQSVLGSIISTYAPNIVDKATKWFADKISDPKVEAYANAVAVKDMADAAQKKLEKLGYSAQYMLGSKETGNVTVKDGDVTYKFENGQFTKAYDKNGKEIELKPEMLQRAGELYQKADPQIVVLQKGDVSYQYVSGIYVGAYDANGKEIKDKAAPADLVKAYGAAKDTVEFNGNHIAALGVYNNIVQAEAMKELFEKRPDLKEACEDFNKKMNASIDKLPVSEEAKEVLKSGGMAAVHDAVMSDEGVRKAAEKANQADTAAEKKKAVEEYKSAMELAAANAITPLVNDVRNLSGEQLLLKTGSKLGFGDNPALATPEQKLAAQLLMSGDVDLTQPKEKAFKDMEMELIKKGITKEAELKNIMNEAAAMYGMAKEMEKKENVVPTAMEIVKNFYNYELGLAGAKNVFYETGGGIPPTEKALLSQSGIDPAKAKPWQETAAEMLMGGKIDLAQPKDKAIAQVEAELKEMGVKEPKFTQIVKEIEVEGMYETAKRIYDSAETAKKTSDVMAGGALGGGIGKPNEEHITNVGSAVMTAVLEPRLTEEGLKKAAETGNYEDMHKPPLSQIPLTGNEQMALGKIAAGQAASYDTEVLTASIPAVSAALEGKLDKKDYEKVVDAIDTGNKDSWTDVSEKVIEKEEKKRDKDLKSLKDEKLG